ncbi:hypothetical protein GW932_00120 [archaeon]|nr:hypothetical protein [archaeon]
MISDCDKCGYKSAKNKIINDKTLCEFCAYFAPEKEEDFNSYVEEKVSWRELQTFRKQEKLGGIRQKRGMKKRAQGGGSVTRPAFGYKIKNNKLTPDENSKLVEEIYLDFLNSNLSLNRLGKKYGFSVMGLKKILTNFTYLGKVKFDGEIHEGNHVPIISSTLFNQVQDRMEKVCKKN